jgi:CRISPR/Cas system CMR-associated protein Cmr5 small subunit
MQNLEQLRAANALEFWREAAQKLAQANAAKADGDNATADRLRREVDQAYGGAGGGDVVSKLPSLIVNNGLLATLAFAKSKEGGHCKLMAALVAFLSKREVQATPAPDGFRQGDGPLDPYIRVLTTSDSIVLQRATTEALAYLSYLKRFAPGD